MIKRVLLASFILATFWLILVMTLPKTFLWHPLQTIDAMRYAPIGTTVMPSSDDRMWCVQYGWGCGKAATVVGYNMVTGFDHRKLLIYVIRVEGPQPITLEVHPLWVLKEGR